MTLLTSLSALKIAALNNIMTIFMINKTENQYKKTALKEEITRIQHEVYQFVKCHSL